MSARGEGAERIAVENRRGDEQLRLAVLDALAAGVVVRHADGRLVGLNAAATRMVGLSPDGDERPDAPMFVRDDGSPLPTHEVPWRHALAPGAPPADDVIGVVTAPDRTVWLAVTTQHVAAGHDTFTMSTLVDITEHIGARRALAASEDRFQALAGVAPLGIFVADALGRCSYTNAHWQALYGLSGEQAAQDGWARTIHRSDRAAVVRQWRAAAQAGRAFEAEFRLGSARDRERWVRARAFPLEASRAAGWGPSGPTGFVGVVEDVTVRRAAAGARISAVFDASPIGIAIVSVDGVVRAVNRALCDLTGRAADRMRGHDLASLVAPEDAANLRTRLREVAERSSSSAEVELVVTRADGERRWALVHLARLGDGDEGPDAGVEIVCQLLDVTQRHRSEEQLRHVADHDSLTGLLNRRSFEAALAAHGDHVARYGPQGALLVLDIDHFKRVNDSLGHQAGDQLIASVATLVRERLRASDTLARLGGDEFAALLPQASLREAEAVATALLASVRTQTVPLDARRRPVTVSIGIALFDPADVAPAEILRAADLAMFAAKEAGRDRFAAAPATAAADAAGHRQGAPRMSWVDRIESALQDDRFSLLAQPIVSLRTGLVAQFELLIRLVDGAELVGPERFLYLAERVDLVALIDRWVLGQALDLLAKRPGETFDLTVNLAQRSLSAPAVLEVLSTRLTDPPFDPRRLILEVGERAALASVAGTQRFLDHASALGCRTALDDFGAGLGSLSCLKYLPFDVLKIDGAVVATCATSAIDRTIVSAITAVAGELGKLTVAEATPDQTTLDLLRRAGVDYAQGYFVGHPQPLEAVFPAGEPAVTRL